jgi:NAD(P)-dependent dehydrogenase (short-subunit alcohol dehydrogenase family)
MFPNGAALVAGGSGGIGAVICAALAEAGTDVVVTYRGNLVAAQKAADQVRSFGRKAEIFQLDLQDDAAVKSVVAKSVERFGAVHTTVYAAGPFVPLKFMSTVTPDEFKTYLTGDILACFNLVHATLPELRKARGSIVSITTTALFRWAPQDGLSAVPKASVDRLMTGIAREEGRFGVRANSVALGVIDAGMFNHEKDKGFIDQNYMDAMARNVPLKRVGTALEVADAAVFLASSRAGYTTGQVIRVDGGYPT